MHLCQTPYANLHRTRRAPPKPLLKPTRIDDVRALAVTLRDGGYDLHDLRCTASAADRCASARAGHRPSAAKFRPEGVPRRRSPDDSLAAGQSRGKKTG